MLLKSENNVFLFISFSVIWNGVRKWNYMCDELVIMNLSLIFRFF